METPPTFGAAFGAVVTEALSWSPDRCAELRDQHDAAIADISDQFDYASDTVYMALLDAGLAEYDCDLDPAEVPAGWVDRVVKHTGFSEVGQVAWAVFARDRGLISGDDFATLTGWWVEAGLPLPEVQSN